MKILLNEEEIKEAIVKYLQSKTQFEFDIPDIVIVCNLVLEVKDIVAECKV